MKLPIYHLRFFLKRYRINCEGKAPIYLRIRINKSKIETSTGQFIDPKYWDSRRSLVVKPGQADQTNMLLETIRSNINEMIIAVYIEHKEISIELVKKALVGECGSKARKLIEVTEEHNKNFEALLNIKYSWGSYKNYKTTLKFLKEFISYQYQQKDVALKEVNNSFCEHYFIWLTTIKKTSHQNGANKQIQRLKKIINYAYSLGYIDDNPIRNYTLSFKVPPRVALTWDEINKIQNLVLAGTLDNVRNVFLFMIWTGLSYSDIKILSRCHLQSGLDDKQWLRMERTKTRNTFTVPLLSPAIEILNKYLINGVESPIFPVLSNQKMNSYLKVIKKDAGIAKNLHSHLPRHTFATTITLQSGVPLETVSKMLGHSKITVTQIYARVGEIKIAEEMKLLEERLQNRFSQG